MIKNFLKFLALILFLIIFKTSLFANTFFSKNKTYSGEITVLGQKIQLLEGDWKLAHKYVWNIVGIQGQGFSLIQTIENKIKAHISIWTISSPGKKEGLIGTIFIRKELIILMTVVMRDLSIILLNYGLKEHQPTVLN